VTGLRVGDAVIAGTYFGGYASHVTIPARHVFKLPSTVDLAAGAAIPVNYFTAQLALFEMARVRAGDRVLIECATGGVGVLAIQMARHAGAEVTGLTTSPHKKAFIEQLGATAYTREEFRADASLRGYDMILNASGGAEINWQRARLGITGRMVCIGISSGVKDGKRNFVRIATAALRTPRISVLKLFDANTGIYALNALHVLEDPAWIERLTKAMSGVEAMNLRPHVGKVFPAAEVGAAHSFLETKQATGKVLLQWPGTAN
jgi:NADPH:quinone reductase-like Zn-dependent oxidoreductase